MERVKQHLADAFRTAFKTKDKVEIAWASFYSKAIVRYQGSGFETMDGKDFHLIFGISEEKFAELKWEWY